MSDIDTELLRDIVRWLRFENLERAKSAVTSLLDTEKKKIAFELTDGKRSSRTIAATAKVDRSSLLRWWADWFPAGILTREGDSYRHLFSLRELGMKLPDSLPQTQPGPEGATS
jgi:hypothetical protein